MWFKRLFHKWKLRRLLNRKILQHKPDRLLCKQLLTELNASSFKIYSPSLGVGILIQTRYNDIETYSAKLKSTSRLLKQGSLIPNNWDIVNEQTISLDRFLISSDGYYLDIQKAISDFKTNGLEFCNLMEDSDTAQYGLPEHNLRMTTNLIINLTLVTKKLIESTIK